MSSLRLSDTTRPDSVTPHTTEWWQGCSARCQFARVVKGVDLRSTAAHCAWVRTPQLTLVHADARSGGWCSARAQRQTGASGGLGGRHRARVRNVGFWAEWAACLSVGCCGFLCAAAPSCRAAALCVCRRFLRAACPYIVGQALAQRIRAERRSLRAACPYILGQALVQRIRAERNCTAASRSSGERRAG